jgi:hypothetical protein
MWLLSVTVATVVSCAGGDGTPDEPAGPPPVSCPAFALASEGLPQSGEWRTLPAVADVNGDGLGDVAGLPRKGSGPHVFLSDGLGGWTESSEGLSFDSTFSCGIGTRFADVNLDSHLDLVIADHCSGVRVYHGDGQGKWVERSEGIPRNMEGWNDAAVGDLDLDGWPDIVAVSGFARGFITMRGTPSGRWEWVLDTGLPRVGAALEIELHDVDGNDLLDIVTSYVPASIEKREGKPPSAKVWLQTSPLRFQPAAGFTDGGRLYGVAIAPRRDRPRPDILVAMVGARAGIHRFEAVDTGWKDTGRIDEEVFGEKPRGFVGLDTADVDHDGCLDLLTMAADHKRVRLALGDCAGNWRFCPADTLPMEGDVVGWGVTAGDINGDGRLDVVAGFGWEARGSMQAWVQTQKQGSAASIASLAPGSAPGSP